MKTTAVSVSNTLRIATYSEGIPRLSSSVNEPILSFWVRKMSNALPAPNRGDPLTQMREHGAELSYGTNMGLRSGMVFAGVSAI